MTNELRVVAVISIGLVCTFLIRFSGFAQDGSFAVGWVGGCLATIIWNGRDKLEPKETGE